MTLILASGSKIRARILADAGYEFTAVPPGIDETPVKEAGLAAGSPLEGIALDLAKAKASVVSTKFPEALVVGADQILGFEGRAFDKPDTMDDAANRLSEMSGKMHYLHNGCCVMRDGQPVWENRTSVALLMHNLTPEEIETYLSTAGEQVLESVGAYQLEGLGARLFEKVEGDYFTILGLPLLPLAAFLKTEMGLKF